MVTGASSGIGEATAKTLAAHGFTWSRWPAGPTGSRRWPREIGGTAIVADVTDDAAVDALAAELDRVDVLVNNAGGARGLAPVADADLEHWRWMWETNVLGTLRVTRALLPKLVDSGDGLIVTVTSVAALETYDSGAGYTAAKHAQGALHRTLRGELLGKPVRLTEIAPGAVETEFSLVRFDGDEERADAVYKGITPLVAEDVAEVIGFVASRPSHVNLDLIVIRPRDQATASRFNRRGSAVLGGLVVVVGGPTGSARRRRGRRGARDLRGRRTALGRERRHRPPGVPVDGPVPDVAVGVGQLDRCAGHFDGIAVHGAVEVLLGVSRSTG